MTCKDCRHIYYLEHTEVPMCSQRKSGNEFPDDTNDICDYFISRYHEQLNIFEYIKEVENVKII